MRFAADLGDALVAGADLVVVATPTASHAAVVGAVRAWDEDVPILLEKPAADRRDDADRVLSATPAVEVIFHTVFGPEVLWATGFCASETLRASATSSPSRPGSAVPRARPREPHGKPRQQLARLRHQRVERHRPVRPPLRRDVVPFPSRITRALRGAFASRDTGHGTRRHDRHDLAGRRAQPVDPFSVSRAGPNSCSTTSPARRPCSRTAPSPRSTPGPTSIPAWRCTTPTSTATTSGRLPAPVPGAGRP